MCSYAFLARVVCLALLGACVNVDKPRVVVQCEHSGKCLNRGADADIGGPSDPAPSSEPDAAQGASQDAITDGDSSPCWSAGSPIAAGTVCRAAAGPCDVPEVCDGVSPLCPDDQYAPTTTACRAAKGECDIAERCTGSSPDCPVDAFLTAGTLCRMVAGPCDLAESCSGTSPDCPTDRMAPAGTICRPSTDTNQCDPEEVCRTSSPSCPADVTYTRPSAPTGVTAAPGTLQATISWPSAPGATGYNVKRSATSGSGYTTQGIPGTLTTSPYVNTGLTGGTTYYYVVSSFNTVATCESDNSAEAYVQASGICTPPATPKVTATALDGQVELTWTASAGATSYAVARSVKQGTGYASVATLNEATSFNDVNLPSGTTYYYVVTASNGSCSSPDSVEVFAAPTCAPPAAPTNVAATANNGSVALTWTTPAGTVSFRILRSESAGTGYTLVGTSGIASYTDAGVVNGTTYYYVVVASNGSCSSANSAWVSATPVCHPPSIPTSLIATPNNTQVVLAWAASTGGATLYQVLRSETAAGPYAAIATPASAGFADTNLTNGTTYYYVVNASNGSCRSANSAEVSAVPVCTPPSVPTIQSVAPADGRVTLSWTASTGSPVSYAISRGPVSGGPYDVLANTTGTTYTDSLAINGTTYYYVVRANNGTCLSIDSAEVVAEPIAACTQAAPTGVTATAGNKQVTLMWAAPAGAALYNIGRSTTRGTGYISIGTVVTTTFVDTDPTLVNGTPYYYVVSASNGSCTSANSSEVSANPACVPPAVPTGVSATADNSNGTISVSWGVVADATGYTVSRGTDPGGPFSPVSTNKTTATFKDSGLTAGTFYDYVVSASNAAGTCLSANSGPAVSALSCSSPSVPRGVTASAGISRVTVSWTASTGSPTSYQIKRGIAATGTFAPIGTSTASPYIDSSVTNGTTYAYVVAARNANGACSSVDSGAVSAAPRSCTVVFGTAADGHTGLFGTTAGRCFVTCDSIAGWNCANAGNRSVTINGGRLSCGALPVPAAKKTGYNVIDVTAGTPDYTEIYWWGPFSNTCSIPTGGLDF